MKLRWEASVPKAELVLEALACGLAEGLEAGHRHEVRSANPECLEFRAVDAALDPLVHRLAGHRRVNTLPGLFDAEILLCVGFTGASSFGRTTGTESCERVSYVHECQA